MAALEPFEKKAAIERAKESGRIGGESKGSVKFTDPSQGRAADKVAAAVGLSRMIALIVREWVDKRRESKRRT